MGTYSVNGSPSLDARIDAHLERIADVVYSSTYFKQWKALVLRGDYGRGEGGRHIGLNGEELPFGEYNLMVVTRALNPLIERTLERMEGLLSEELGMTVRLCPALARSLTHCECSLLNYETKQGHRVIRGKETILSKMTDYAPNRIPLSEGTRLLMNRCAPLLDIKNRLGSGIPLTPREHRRFLQAIFAANLAFGDCALLMCGAYDSSAAVKKRRIGEVDLQGLRGGPGLAEAYRRILDFKERGSFQPLESENIHALFADTTERFGNVFLWYERRRLNRKFRTLEKYARTFPHLGNEGQPLKNAVLNLREFGLGAPPGLFAHPRLRLYAALPLLLLTPHPDRGEIRWLLRSNRSTIEDLCDVFYSLQKHFE
ncbi:MAG: hypothetical protein JEZ10_07620 [Verrucomicrobia bacterium]|nr:hypothetical protein [Verrucomicrobiota bacterium]